MNKDQHDPSVIPDAELDDVVGGRSQSGSSGRRQPEQEAAAHHTQHLSSGVERLGGNSMSDVNVHRGQPSQGLGAHAYATGREIHTAPAEGTLPHEGEHQVPRR